LPRRDPAFPARSRPARQPGGVPPPPCLCGDAGADRRGGDRRFPRPGRAAFWLRAALQRSGRRGAGGRHALRHPARRALGPAGIPPARRCDLMRARRVHIRGAALALLSVAAVPAAAAAQPAQQPVAVEFVEVRQQPLVLDLRLVGTIAASDSIDLSFPAGGRITEITVRAGDRVQAGDPLARTDGVQQQQALNQALAAVTAAEATLQQADQAAIRADEMLRRGVGTRAESDMANQALSAAQGQLAAARTGADQSQRAVDDTVIHAPQAAVVTARMAEPGQVVGAAQPILTLAALTGFEAVFNVP